jgi:hypothetical protein
MRFMELLLIIADLIFHSSARHSIHDRTVRDSQPYSRGRSQYALVGHSSSGYDRTRALEPRVETRVSVTVFVWFPFLTLTFGGLRGRVRIGHESWSCNVGMEVKLQFELSSRFRPARVTLLSVVGVAARAEAATSIGRIGVRGALLSDAL